MHRDLRASAMFLLLMSFLLGGVYPLCVWAVGSALFPHEAAGSLVFKNGEAIGSTLIGQNFTSERFFWPRPSATTGRPYEALGSGASNLGAANTALLDRIRNRMDELDAVKGKGVNIPVDLLTTSGSGLDPHISPEAALFQIDRIAKARGLKAQDLHDLIRTHTIGRTFGLFGEPRVNVLALNLALDRLPARGSP